MQTTLQNYISLFGRKNLATIRLPFILFLSLPQFMGVLKPAHYNRFRDSFFINRFLLTV